MTANCIVYLPTWHGTLLQLTTLLYYLHETNPDNLLVRDKTEPNAPVSIAAVGMALATTPVVVERGIIIRELAARDTLKRLRFLLQCPQGPEPDGLRLQRLLLSLSEHRNRPARLAVRAVDHRFGVSVRGGVDGRQLFRPRHRPRGRDPKSCQCALPAGGLELGSRWRSHTHARLAAGERIHPPPLAGVRRRPAALHPGIRLPHTSIAAESYRAYCATYQWRSIYGRELLYSAPLFTHQLSHMWIDFRGIRDGFMREHDSDYFENSRQATFVQQEYAVRNPMNFAGYGKDCWGFTACDGPGWIKRLVSGVERQFFDYAARGAPFGPMMAPSHPWVVVASLRSLRRSSYQPCAILLKWNWV